MKAKFFRCRDISYTDHPKFANVRIALLVSRIDTEAVSVSFLEIAPATEIPIHIHDPQVDSIYIDAGQGQAYVNGAWQEMAAGDYIFVPAGVEHGIRNTGDAILRLFVHHGPALL